MTGRQAFITGIKHGLLGVSLLLLWALVDYLSRREDFIVRK